MTSGLLDKLVDTVAWEPLANSSANHYTARRP